MLPRSDPQAPALPAESFEAVAATLRSELLSQPGLRGNGAAGRDTLETNSGYVERRGQPLVEIVRQRTASDSLAGSRLLDLGCGFGALSVFFAFRGATVDGIDSNRTRLEIGRRVAERHDLAVELTPARMEELPFPDRGFDVAVMNNSLCYLVDASARDRALREALRVLAPGGVLVVRNPNRLHPVDQFTGLPLLQMLPPRTAVSTAARLGRKRSLSRLMTPHGASRELRAAGFEGVLHHAAPHPSPRPKLVAQYSHHSAVRPGGSE